MSVATVENLGPRPALRLLCAALLLGVLPLFGEVSAAAVLLLLIVLLFRLSGRYLSRSWGTAGRLALGVAGGTAILLKYGRLIGMEPGISILILLIALKAVEARNRRDFRILTLLAFFLCLTILFYSQSLPMVCYAVLVLGLALAGLPVLESRGELASWRALGEVGRLLLMAAPLIALLFVLFPRNLAISFALRRGLFAQSGMNDELRPGSVASVALSNEEAFRATFLDGQIPSQAQLYWRGAVLTYGNGLEWDPGIEDWSGLDRAELSGSLIRQRILLRPHGEIWLYALDRPAADVKGGRLRPGHVLRARSPVNSRLSYEAVSRMGDEQASLSANEKALLTRPPRLVAPRVRELAAQLREGAAGPEEISQRALRYFRRHDFSYTIDPGSFGSDGLEEFLFERRTGFCEHFAASFATLMRLAGVPARVVVGFQGGELNRAAAYVIVRNSDAHAWAEIWIEGQGWQRVDPTSVVAPGRLVSGLGTFLEGQAAGVAPEGGLAQSSGALGLRAVWQDLRLTWDNVQMQWDLHVMDYGRDQQEELLALAGIPWKDAGRLLSLMAGAILVMAALAAAWFSWAGRGALDPGARHFQRFDRKAARAGLARQPAEGPQAFSRRLALAFPGSAAAIDAFVSAYLRHRYGVAQGGDAKTLRGLLRRIDLPRRRETRLTPESSRIGRG